MLLLFTLIMWREKIVETVLENDKNYGKAQTKPIFQIKFKRQKLNIAL